MVESGMLILVLVLKDSLRTFFQVLVLVLVLGGQVLVLILVLGGSEPGGPCPCGSGPCPYPGPCGLVLVLGGSYPGGPCPCGSGPCPYPGPCGLVLVLVLVFSP